MQGGTGLGALSRLIAPKNVTLLRKPENRHGRCLEHLFISYYLYISLFISFFFFYFLGYISLFLFF